MSTKSDQLHGAELWDYELARPIGPFPVRALVGLNFLTVQEPILVPSFFVGMSVTAPLVESPSILGTSLAVGAYWEVDLRHSEPFNQGNHFFLTLGFNAFSLVSVPKN